jgi:pimeloyl-ACP methyl ester carboxylesterase
MTPEAIETALRRAETEMRYGWVSTPRYRCRYALWGEGPPLVFVHGLTDRAMSFALVLSRLTDKFTGVIFELAEGLADGARLGAYRHRHHAEDLIVLLDHLGYDQVNLVGSSYGSTIALRTTATYPSRVRRLVLQGGFARRPLRWFERGPARLARYWPGRIGDVPGRGPVLDRLDGPQFVAAPAEAYQLFRGITSSTPIRAFTRRSLVLDRLDLRPWLPDIRLPVLLVGGDDDWIVPRRYEAELEAGLSDVRRVEIARCGHYPQYTQPEAMADAIRNFLLP